jgi:mannose-1-phosphate guanylyltransferase/mannose-6-phosphate isomerase
MDGGIRIEAGETVASGRHYRIRRIKIVPGGQSGRRVHRHRTNHYVVLAGEALFTRGNDVIRAGPESSIFVPFGVPHRLKNTGRGTLSVLEVQVGSRFEEDDLQGTKRVAAGSASKS